MQQFFVILAVTSLLSSLSFSLRPSPVYHRILIIGNSITLSHPSTTLGWSGYWGMAASQADRDWIHRLQLILAARQGFVPEIAIVRADIHSWATITKQVTFRNVSVQEFAPDLVIVQMGDNASTETPYENWLAAYQTIKSWTPDARFIALGKWGGRVPNDQENYIKQASAAAEMQYIYIRDLHTDGNVASQFANTDVAWHPNDHGMRLIAERVADALNSVWLPGVQNGTMPPDR